MTLDEYLKQHGSARLLAEKSGISPPEISRMRSGKKKVTFQNAALIEYGTDGAIKMESMVDDEELLLVVKYIRANGN